jgi:hypothetical protein
MPQASVVATTSMHMTNVHTTSALNIAASLRAIAFDADYITEHRWAAWPHVLETS